MGRSQMNEPAERYACLYAKEFPVQALLRLRPELHNQPCVVMKGESPLQQVCSFNTKARLIGMEHAMTRVEVDTFPQSTVLSRSLQSEAATKDTLLECAAAFSPRIEDRSEDAALLFGIRSSSFQAPGAPFNIYGGLKITLWKK